LSASPYKAARGDLRLFTPGSEIKCCNTSAACVAWQMLKLREDKTMSNTEQLCADWLEAKRNEETARNQRIAIESQLAEAFDVPDEGSKTHHTDTHKLTLTQPVYRTVNPVEWKNVAAQVPHEMRPIKTKIEADAAGCKYLANNEPELWRKIASAFESKPGKVSVKVEAK